LFLLSTLFGQMHQKKICAKSINSSAVW